MINQSELNDIISRLRDIANKSDKFQLSQGDDGRIFQIMPIVLNGDHESLPSITQQELESIPPDVACDLIEEFKEKFSH